MTLIEHTEMETIITTKKQYNTEQIAFFDKVILGTAKRSCEFWGKSILLTIYIMRMYINRDTLMLKQIRC